MSYEPVDVTLTEWTPAGTPLEGVAVRLFSADGRIPYGQVTTGVNGRASFLLPAPSVYQARFYKFGVSFKQPLLLDVRAAVPNVFRAQGEPHIYAQAIDPRLCLASGFFRQPDGSPAPYLTIRMDNQFQPMVLDGSAVFPKDIYAQTDERGYASIHLIRFGLYDAYVTGLEECHRRIAVPDRAWVNLPDLLLPIVESIEFDVAVPFSVPVGTALRLRPTIYASDFRELPYNSGDVLWSVGDGEVAALDFEAEYMTIRGLKPGLTTLSAARADRSVVHIPTPPIHGVPVSLAVVP